MTEPEPPVVPDEDVPDDATVPEAAEAAAESATESAEAAVLVG